jgi:hypothetical protein
VAASAASVAASATAVPPAAAGVLARLLPGPAAAVAVASTDFAHWNSRWSGTRLSGGNAYWTYVPDGLHCSSGNSDRVPGRVWDMPGTCLRLWVPHCCMLRVGLKNDSAIKVSRSSMAYLSTTNGLSTAFFSDRHGCCLSGLPSSIGPGEGLCFTHCEAFILFGPLLVRVVSEHKQLFAKICLVSPLHLSDVSHIRDRTYYATTWLSQQGLLTCTRK